jgi:hypothetical protein
MGVLVLNAPSSWLRLTSAILAAAALSLAAEPARAQTPQQLAAARRAFKEGEDAETRGDNTTAAAKFKEALAVKETPQLNIRLGSVQEKLGRLVDALASYERGLDKSSGPAVAKIAHDLVETLRPRVPVVRLRVTGQGAGTLPDLTVTLDGNAVDAAALNGEIRLDPGQHKLHAEASGFNAGDKTFRLVERDKIRVELVLAPVAAQPVAPKTPQEGPSSSGRVRGGVLLGVGIVAAGVGAGLIGASVAKDGAINTLCGSSARTMCPAADKSTILSDVTEVNALRFSGIAFVLLGAGGIATGSYFLATSRKPDSAEQDPPATSLRFVPEIGKGRAGAVFSGSF